MFKAIVRFLSFGMIGAEDGFESYALSNPLVKRIFGGDQRSTAGIPINARTALTCSAWWRGLDLLSDAVAKVPYGVYRNLGDDKGKILDRQHPWHYALSRKPGDHWTAFQFRKLMIFSVAHRGNAYAYIDRDNYTLTPISPDELTPISTSDGIRYHYTPNGKFYHPDEILHYKGMGFDGLVGYSVLECAAESLGLSLAARRFQAKSFKNSARPSVILQFPKKLSGDQKQKIKDDWERMLQGADNAKSTIVIDGEMEVKDFAMSAADIQLMETQRFTVIDIANFLGVPPHKLGSKEGQGYNSLEQENLAWNADKLEAMYVNIEQEDEDKLLTEDEKKAGSHEIAFDRTAAAFASADLAAKSNYLRTALGGHPWMQQSEARQLDGWNHVEGTDFIPAPANMGGGNNEPKNPASDPPKRADDGKPTPLQAATAAALESSCRRVVRRLGSQAKAAAKRGELSAFTVSLTTDNLAAVVAELEHVEAAAGLAHGVDLKGKSARQVLSHLTHRLEKASTPDDVESATVAACALMKFLG